MTFKKRFREITNNAHSQEENNDDGDYTKKRIRREEDKENKKPATDKDGYSPGENNGSKDYTKQPENQQEAKEVAELQKQIESYESNQHHQSDADRACGLSKIWGLHHLQDMSGSTAIPGAYDGKQERWISQETEPGLLDKTSRSTGVITSRHVPTGDKSGRDDFTESDLADD